MSYDIPQTGLRPTPIRIQFPGPPEQFFDLLTRCVSLEVARFGNPLRERGKSELARFSNPTRERGKIEPARLSNPLRQRGKKRGKIGCDSSLANASGY